MSRSPTRCSLSVGPGWRAVLNLLLGRRLDLTLAWIGSLCRILRRSWRVRHGDDILDHCLSAQHSAPETERGTSQNHRDADNRANNRQTKYEANNNENDAESDQHNQVLPVRCRTACHATEGCATFFVTSVDGRERTFPCSQWRNSPACTGGFRLRGAPYCAAARIGTCALRKVRTLLTVRCHSSGGSRQG